MQSEWRRGIKVWRRESAGWKPAATGNLPMPGQTEARTIEWIGGVVGFVRLIDQTRLPGELVYRECRAVDEVWEAIRSLQVRGAPAIGIAAAMGALLGLHQHTAEGPAALGERLRAAAVRLRTSRPTAVNLFWALARMECCLERATDGGVSSDRLLSRLLDEAREIAEEDRRVCLAMGDSGAHVGGE